MRVVFALTLISTPALAWTDGNVPASTLLVSHARGDAMFLLKWLDRQKLAPECYASLRARVNGMAQLELGGSSKSLFVFEGQAPRDVVETCAKSIADRLFAESVTVTRSGDTTRFEGPHAFSLGFSPGVVLYDDEDEGMRLGVAAMRGKGQASPALRTIAKRANRAGEMWAASPRDYTGKVLGIPSVGMLMDGSAKDIAVHLLYANAVDAQKVVAQIESPAFKQQHPALGRAVTGIAKANGAQVDIAMSRAVQALSSDPQAMKDAQDLLAAAQR